MMWLFALAYLVWRADSKSLQNRFIATLLTVEGFKCLWIALDIFPFMHEWNSFWVVAWNIKFENNYIDLIISNEAIHQKGLGFESDMNEVCIIEKDSILKIPKNTKKIIADIILSRIAKNIKGNLIKIKNAR